MSKKWSKDFKLVSISNKILLSICMRYIIVILLLSSLSTTSLGVESALLQQQSTSTPNHYSYLLYNMTQQNLTHQMIANKNLQAKLLANNLQTILNKSASILEVTGNSSEIKNTLYTKSIGHTLHGIPQNLDQSKRDIARNILKSNKDFNAIFFALANGNVYFVEPYSRQQNLTVNNLSFRDYFKGAVATHNVYLGGVIVSLSSGQRIADIAVPIYSDKGVMLGIWGGALEFSVFDKSLKGLNLAQLGEYVVYLDQYGNKVADSNQDLFKHTESFANLQSFKNAMEGKTGSLVESVNNTKMLIVYQPVKLATTTWVVLLMQPYNEMLASSNR